MSFQTPSIFRNMWVVAGLFLMACESSGEGQPVCINDCPVQCGNGVQDGLETGVDCGGECSPCVVAASCSNGVQDGLETGVDCGGECSPCVVAASCSNGVKDGLETDVDCGGDCSPCVVAASCSNGVKDGAETDIDCGGSCPPCGPGAVCAVGSDCVAGVCADAVCVDPTCDDAVRNGFESDVDCGPGCEPCSEGQTCGFDPDCGSGACSEGVCVTCDDGVKNANETGVDCGGGLCDPCGEGGACEENTDCESAACEDNVCIGCSDGVQNGDEEDVDCGGASCEPCLTQACEDDSTCFHGLCIDGRCALPVPTKLAARGGHVCALVQKGRVRCWGDPSDSLGTLGQSALLRAVGTKDATGAVVQIEGMTHIFAGKKANCASGPDALYCWGAIAYEPPFGNYPSVSSVAAKIWGTYRPQGTQFSQAVSMGGATSMGIGGDHACAQLGDRVYCWGYNQYNQLGRDSTGPSVFTPSINTDVGLQGWATQVVAGDTHSCALRADGAVVCWGRNNEYQCGSTRSEEGDGYAYRTVLPQFVQPGQGASAVFAAGYASCALADGTVRCWGQRPFLAGTGAQQYKDIPFMFEGWSGVTHFALGEHRVSGGTFMCAKTENGVSCVGAATGSMGLNPTTPTAIAGLEGADVVDLVAGQDFACALLADGEVRCWGANDKGQLGDGTTESRAMAAPWVF